MTYPSISPTTRLSEICQQVHDGELPWETAKEELVNYSYQDPHNDYSAEIDIGWTPGSWDEVVHCFDHGLLTKEQFLDLIRTIFNKARDEAVAKKAKQSGKTEIPQRPPAG